MLVTMFPDTDKLIDSDLTRADLVCLLRKAQAERDALLTRALNAEADATRAQFVMAAANVILDALKAKQTPKHEVVTDLAAHWRAECVEDTVAALKAELDNLPPEQRFATMIDMWGRDGLAYYTLLSKAKGNT